MAIRPHVILPGRADFMGPYSNYEVQNARCEFVRVMSVNESAAIIKLKRKCQFAMYGPTSNGNFQSHDNIHFRDKDPVNSPPIEANDMSGVKVGRKTERVTKEVPSDNISPSTSGQQGHDTPVINTSPGRGTNISQPSDTINVDSEHLDQVNLEVAETRFHRDFDSPGNESSPADLFGKPRKRGNECLQPTTEEYPFGRPSLSSNKTERLWEAETFPADTPDAESYSTGEPAEKMVKLDGINMDNCWRCDLCDFTIVEKSVMEAHLRTKLHYSASLCKFDNSKTEMKAVSLVCRAKLTHTPAMFKSLVPVCPQKGCTSLFKDIYVCSLHYSVAHNNPAIRDMYAVAEVELDETVPYCDTKTCKCGKEFSKAKQLVTHWGQANHHPYTHTLLRKDSWTFQVFLCGHCPKCFYTFMEANHHLHNRAEVLKTSKKFSKQQKKKKARNLTIRVLTVRKSGKIRYHLPEHHTQRTEVVVRDEMKQLRKLRKVNRNKAARRTIRKELKSLRQIEGVQQTWSKANKSNKYCVKY